MIKFGILPLNLITYYHIYAFHLCLPELSQRQVALEFDTSKSVVWQAYRFMEQRS